MSKISEFDLSLNKKDELNDHENNDESSSSTDQEISGKEIIDALIKKNIPSLINSLEISFIHKDSNSYINYKEFIDLSEDHKDKIKFDEWIKEKVDMNKKLEEEILKTLIEIFDKRYKIYPNNVCGLSSRALQLKKNIENICPKFYELSIYMLYLLYNQFKPFFEYVIKKINLKNIQKDKYKNIKEIMYHIGKDIKKIFKCAIDNIEKIKLPNILIVILEEYFIQEKKIKDKNIKNLPLYKDKENFEKILKEINSLFFEKNYESILDKTLCFVEEEKNKDDESNIQNNTNRKKVLNESGDNINHKVENLNIEELVNYINGPKTTKNKKKKKKKKSAKTDTNKNKEITIENNYIEEDLEFLNYKKSLEEFTKNIGKTEKIKPKCSEEFLKRLELL